MIAKREIRNYIQSTKVWAGKYRNSHNLLHWHYDCELIYVDNGSIDVNCEKRTHRLKQGDALFVDSGQVHFQRARDRETVLTLIIFDYGIVKPYLGDVRLLSPKLSGDYEIPAAYAKLRSILLGKQEFYGAEAASEVLRLMVRIFRGGTADLASGNRHFENVQTALGGRERKLQRLHLRRRGSVHEHERRVFFALLSCGDGHHLFAISEFRAHDAGGEAAARGRGFDNGRFGKVRLRHGTELQPYF